MKLDKSVLPPGKLLVKQKKITERMQSGIIIPENVCKKENLGTVVKIGPFRTNEILDGLQVGSEVTYDRMRKEIILEGEEFLYMDVMDVLLYNKVQQNDNRMDR